MRIRRRFLAVAIHALGLSCCFPIPTWAGSAAPGDLLVSQFGSPTGVRRYNGPNGAFVELFASDGLQSHWAMTYGPDGNLYVARGNGQITRYNGQTGALMGLFATTTNVPTGVTFGPDGHLYVVNEGTDVRRFHGFTGAAMGAFVSAGSGGLARAEELTFGPDGNLYVADGDNDRVLRYDGATGAFINVFLTDPAIAFVLVDLTFGPDGHLYLLDTDATVRRYHGVTGAFLNVFVSPGSGGLTGVFHMVFGPDGNLYIPSADVSDSSVRRYNGQTGAFMGVFVSHGSGGLEFPFDLAFVPECFNASECDDNNVCNGAESCVFGACVAGALLVCNDLDPCTNDACDPVQGCVYTNNTAPCEDGDPCTTNDRCSAGNCIGLTPSGGIAHYDIAPCGGDGTVNIDDILALLSAFAGNYSCTDPCP